MGTQSKPVVKNSRCGHDGMILEHPADRAQARRFIFGFSFASRVRVAGLWCFVVAFVLVNPRVRCPTTVRLA